MLLATNQRVDMAMSEHNACNSKGKIIQMKCPGCGAGLEISKEHQEFSCGYCGSSLNVIRSGGTVALSLVNVVDQVRVNTDRTASELALVRLADELQEIKSGISKYTETLSTVAVRPVPLFGNCFPLGKDRKPDYSKDMINELGGLIGMTVIAVVCGALFHWLLFLAIFALALFVIIPARAARIKEAKEKNESVPGTIAFYQSLLSDLHLKEVTIEDQITAHRSLLNSVVARQ
jgi:hypothetical protein